jgi:hypothetical protein
MVLSLSAIALWFGLAVCPAPARTTAAPILRGQVIDAENKPLAGATVMVNETGAHQTTENVCCDAQTPVSHGWRGTFGSYADGHDDTLRR